MNKKTNMKTAEKTYLLLERVDRVTGAEFHYYGVGLTGCIRTKFGGEHPQHCYCVGQQGSSSNGHCYYDWGGFGPLMI